MVRRGRRTYTSNTILNARHARSSAQSEANLELAPFADVVAVESAAPMPVAMASPIPPLEVVDVLEVLLGDCPAVARATVEDCPLETRTVLPVVSVVSVNVVAPLPAPIVIGRSKARDWPETTKTGDAVTT